MSAPPDRFTALTDERLALLLSRLRTRAAPRDDVVEPVPRTGAGRYPLSAGQEELYFLTEFAPENAAYSVPVLRRLTGALVPSALSRALKRVTLRHEPLRTRLSEQDGRLAQIVEPQARTALVVMDVPEEQLLDRVVGECARPFDLRRAPLLRAVLFRVGPDDHTLVLNSHHVVSDGWSGEVLWRDLVECYAAELAGTEPDLPALPLQFVDFAAWQSTMLADAHHGELVDYWRTRLSGVRPLDLPTDRPRLALPTFRGAVSAHPVPEATANGLRALGRGEHVTDFMAFLAGFAVLLHRHSGQTDLAIGTMAHGRDRPGLADVLGYFAHPVVLRTDLGAGPSFLEVLRRIRRTAVDDLAHADLPFHEIVRAAGIRGGGDRSPLFQVMFIHVPDEAERPAARTMPGVECAGMDVDFGVARYDLVLNVVARGSRFSCVFEYNTDLYTAETVERMAHDYVAILDAVVADPRGPLPSVPTGGEAG